MVEEFFGFALEVIELIVERPNLVLFVFLLDHWVELCNNFLSLFSHLLNLVLDDTDHFIFIALDSAADVFVNKVDDIVDFSKVLRNQPLRFVNWKDWRLWFGIEESRKGCADGCKGASPDGRMEILNKRGESQDLVFHVWKVKEYFLIKMNAK